MSVVDTDIITSDDKSLNEEITRLIQLLNGQGENIFLVCDVFKDGIGDADIFGKLASKFTEISTVEGYKIFRVVTCYQKMQQAVFEKLERYHLADKTHLICYDDTNSPAAALLDFLQQKKPEIINLNEALKTAHAFFNTSTRRMETSILPALGYRKNGLQAKGPGEVPIATLAEIGGSSYAVQRIVELDGSIKMIDGLAKDLAYANSTLMRVLGVATRHHGLILDNTTEISRTKSLSSIQDKAFLTALVGEKGDNIEKIDDKEAQEFLSNRLLVPLFFQEGSDVFTAVVNALITYAKGKYKEVVLSVNKGNFDHTKFKMSFLREQNVSEISYVVPGKHQRISVFKDKDKIPDKALRVKVLEGFYLNDADYDALIRSGDLYGCSGDNSLSRAISYRIFPIFQVRNFKKQFWFSFILVLEHLAPEINFDPLKEMLLLNAKEFANAQKNVQKRLIIILNPTLIKLWPELIKKFREKYNFLDVYPFIVQQVLCQARINRISQTTPEAPILMDLKKLMMLLEQKINRDDRTELKAFLERLASPSCPSELELRYRFFDPLSLMHIFKELQNNKKVRVLYFSESEGDTETVWPKFVAMLKENTSIQTLDLAGNGISAEMLKALVEVLIHKPNITRLNLSFNCFQKAAMLHLKRLLQEHPTLAVLDLACTGLDDVCITILAEGLKAAKSIQAVALDKNPKITKLSLPLLAVARGQNSRIQISLDDALLAESANMSAPRTSVAPMLNLADIQSAIRASAMAHGKSPELLSHFIHTLSQARSQSQSATIAPRDSKTSGDSKTEPPETATPIISRSKKKKQDGQPQ